MPLPVDVFLVAPHQLVVRHWPDENEHLVYHELSGNLHLITPLASRVLAHLAEGPARLHTIPALQKGVDAQTMTQIVETLMDLGLVSRAKP